VLWAGAGGHDVFQAGRFDGLAHQGAAARLGDGEDLLGLVLL